jgi:hypothetical protein
LQTWSILTHLLGCQCNAFILPKSSWFAFQQQFKENFFVNSTRRFHEPITLLSNMQPRPAFSTNRALKTNMMVKQTFLQLVEISKHTQQQFQIQAVNALSSIAPFEGEDISMDQQCETPQEAGTGQTVHVMACWFCVCLPFASCLHFIAMGFKNVSDRELHASCLLG